MTSDYILGLDISTSCTGVALISPTGSLIDLTTHVPVGNTLVEKADHFRQFLVEEISAKYTQIPTDVFIEQNLQKLNCVDHFI